MTNELIDNYDEEDGPGAGPSERDWKGMCTALFVILFICSLITIAIVIFTPLSSNTQYQSINWEDLRALEPGVSQSWWSSPTAINYVVKGRGVSQLDVLTGNISKVADSLFFPREYLDPPVEEIFTTDGDWAAKIYASPDNRYDPGNVTYEIVLQNRDPRRTVNLGLGGKKVAAKISVFTWSGSKAHSHAFVQGGQVYFCIAPTAIPFLVSDASERGVIHGVYDWVYKEEIAATHQALWFSPSNNYLAYASHADKSSREVLALTYLHADNNEKYVPFEYPKIGDKHLPVVSLSIWSQAAKKSRTMDVQLRESAKFHYLFSTSWMVLHGREFVLATWANRWQNETSLTLCDYDRATCSLIYEHRYETGQWAEPDDYGTKRRDRSIFPGDRYVVHTNDSFFIILPRAKRGNAWQHIARIQVTEELKQKSVTFVPAGDYDITAIVGYVEASNAIVFATRAPHPWQQHVYAAPVEYEGSPRSKVRSAKCISCLMENCTYIQAPSLAPNPNAIILEYKCAGPGIGFNVALLLNETLDAYKIEYINRVRMPEKKLNLPPWKTKTYVLPSGFEAIVRHHPGDHRVGQQPVIFCVYGGPNQNQVSDRINLNPMPAGFKYAIVYVDVRGSGGRGWKYRSPIYGKLGTVEVEDHFEAFKMVLDDHPEFDRHRTAVFGWSYGGFMTLRLVELATPSFFRCAIAVAPVTNFLYYDATYTERYMADAPPSAYTQSDVMMDVSKFNSTRLLLLHGLRDDNVHFHNSAVFMAALQTHDIEFETMLYPNQDHSIANGVGEHRAHLFSKFLHKCFTTPLGTPIP